MGYFTPSKDFQAFFDSAKVYIGVKFTKGERSISHHNFFADNTPNKKVKFYWEGEVKSNIFPKTS